MSQLSDAIQEMRNMREAYDQLLSSSEALSPDIVQGKAAIAQAITDKGVATQPDATLADMAENIGDIQQVTTVIDGGDMYAAQMTGDGVLWNLYEVLAQMKSQYMGAGHYAALIVCEYYKGYDSLQLQGADAYYTCDGDFYNTSSPLHVWHDSDNGKSNRWVCFLFATEGARLDITNTAISPRSMYIGGHIGTIEYFVNGRLTELVSGVEETDVLDNFITGTYTQAWGFNTYIKAGVIKGSLLNNQSKQGTFCIEITNAMDNFYFSANTNSPIVISAKLPSICRLKNAIIVRCPDLVCVYINGVEEITTDGYPVVDFANTVQTVYMPDLKRIIADYRGLKLESINLIDVKLGELVTNADLHLWNPTSVLSDADKTAQLVDNIKNHILARISDATGGAQLVFKVSTDMFNAISGETITWNDQTMTLADAFLTKNWLLAGA